MPSLSKPSRALEFLTIAGLLLAVATMYAIGIRTDHDWGGDFSMYLMNARNLVEGRPYGQTGFLHEMNITVGPGAYPPGFPMLLAGPIAIHGLEIETIKRYMVAFPILFLGLFYILVRLRVSIGFALCACIGLAASPMLWDLKERILSDIPFLMWLYLTFVFAQLSERSPNLQRRPALSGIALGCIASLCIATRTVGFVLVPALLLVDLWQARTIRNRTWVALAVVALSWGILAATLQLESDYLRLARALTESGDPNLVSTVRPWTLLGIDFGALPSRLLAIPGDLSVFWTWANPGDKLTVAPTALLGLCALAGIVVTWRRQPGLHDMFAPLYLIALLLLPAGLGTEARLFLPIQTLLYFYAAIGLHSLYSALGGRTWALIPAFLLAAFLSVSYFRSFSNLNFHSFVYGPLGPQATETFEYIREHTDSEARFVFSKPRVLVLFTDRQSGALPLRTTAQNLGSALANSGANYLLVHRLLDRDLIVQLPRASARLREIYRSETFLLFEIINDSDAAAGSRERRTGLSRSS